MPPCARQDHPHNHRARPPPHFNVNTLSHYFLAQEFLPSMVRANHGMVVTVASAAAYITAPRMVDYSASKAAALAFHEG